MSLATIPYPLIDPIAFEIGPVTVRWYGISYVLAFALAWVVLRGLARRDRWPVPEEKVADVLFWGILGVFLGGRIGWILFYGMHGPGFRWQDAWRVWEGGMSFHGGLAGVVIAYVVFVKRTGKPLGDFFDGLTLATPLGIMLVRLANFVNAELVGRPWDGPWAMRFPDYEAVQGGPQGWLALHERAPEIAPWTEPRHPSQLYEALGEGLLLFLVLRWLMLRRGVGGGRIAGLFLVGYGLVRFLVEFVRRPDPGLGFTSFGLLTRGQELSLLMVLAGVAVLVACRLRRGRRGDAEA